MALTKADLIDSIHNHFGLPKMKAIELVETTLEIMKKTLESGDDVMTSGFRKFQVIYKKQRIRRIPAMNENLILPLVGIG